MVVAGLLAAGLVVGLLALFLHRPSTSALAQGRSSATRRPALAPPATAAGGTGPTAPLTGLPYPAGTSRSRIDRPALSVKVDNVSAALPQFGLDRADLVTEDLVEGGLTRLLATYQSADAPLIGPIRSARPVDGPLLAELGGGIFAYAGAAAGEIAPVIRYSTSTLVSWLSPDPAALGFRTVAGRVVPHQVAATTAALYRAGARLGAPQLPPPPLFSYSSAPAAGARPVTGVELRFSPRSTAAWEWDGSSGSWLRDQDGAPDVLADGSRVTATDVVVLSVGTGHTGIFDAAGNEDPLVEVVGAGPCWVLRNGAETAGRWQRPSVSARVRLLGPGGARIPLAPGRTWLELLPRPAQPSFS